MEAKQLKRFIEYLENNPYKGKQESCGKGETYWDSDMWTIAVAKCLYEGSSNCPIGKQIKQSAENKRNMFNRIKPLQHIPSLFVCEVGRGLDILIANMIKEWNTIYCYDHVDYKEELSQFPNVQFYHTSTHGFNTSVIQEDVLMIMNHSKCNPMLHQSDHIKGRIVDGNYIQVIGGRYVVNEPI
jgi:hypothetical protein